MSSKLFKFVTDSPWMMLPTFPTMSSQMILLFFLCRIYLGGHTCQLLKGPDVFYNLTLTNGDEGVFTCKPISTFIGEHDQKLI